MIRKTIVAAAFLLAFPALADDTGEKMDIRLLEEGAAPYITCVMTTLERLKVVGKPETIGNRAGYVQRWVDIVNEKCDRVFIPRLRFVYDTYKDKTIPDVYYETVVMAMGYVTRNQAIDTYYRWLMGDDYKK